MGKSIRIDALEITWLGHAGFMFKSGDTVAYIDPYKVSHGEKADIIMITHDHYDHCDPASVSSISKENTIIVAPKSCREKLKRIREIKVGQIIKEKDLEITAVPAYNRLKQFHPEGFGVGYVFSIAGKRIYHAGDTDNIPEMDNLDHIDVALLPVGGTYTMNAHEAAEAVGRIRPKLAIPMHWGEIVGTRKDAEEFKRISDVKVEILD